ncbi:hypothetical protein GCM10027416_03020 [Okibacterium endophyticum]
MARLHLLSDRLEITLTTAEKVLALRKSDIVVPREAIRSATITDDPWIWVRGIRAPGTAIPLSLAVGQWKFHGGKDFLVIKGSRAAVVIDVEGEEFARLVVTTTHALELVAALRLDERAPKKARTRAAKPRELPGSGAHDAVTGGPAKRALEPAAADRQAEGGTRSKRKRSTKPATTDTTASVEVVAAADIATADAVDGADATDADAPKKKTRTSSAETSATRGKQAPVKKPAPTRSKAAAKKPAAKKPATPEAEAPTASVDSTPDTGSQAVTDRETPPETGAETGAETLPESLPERPSDET